MEPVRRRALVLTDETARHPFRQSLPPHCRHPLGMDDAMPGALAAPALRDWRAARAIVGADVRWFAAVYGAGVVATFAFIV